VDLPTRSLRVALDGDTAGQQAAVRAYPLLQPAVADVTAVVFPDGRDPADILAGDGREALRDTLATSIRPLADLVVDAKIAQWERDGELKFTEQQISALRAAAQVIATMPAAEVGRQATRLAELFTRRYNWPHPEVTREVIDAVEHHFQTHDGSGQWLPGSAEKLTAVAIAPPGTGTSLPRPETQRPPVPGSRDTAERGLSIFHAWLRT
jgi:DNA primase